MRVRVRTCVRVMTCLRIECACVSEGEPLKQPASLMGFSFSATSIFPLCLVLSEIAVVVLRLTRGLLVAGPLARCDHIVIRQIGLRQQQIVDLPLHMPGLD